MISSTAADEIEQLQLSLEDLDCSRVVLSMPAHGCRACRPPGDEDVSFGSKTLERDRLRRPGTTLLRRPNCLMRLSQ
jgi:hypothetical protein